tara:strand:+ start:534 stop:665 length:132 start_codon:yes stop_codon:yes gene_type:complete
MKKVLKPAGTALSKKMKGKVEKLGLPSDKQIKNSVYAKCGKKK